MDRVERMDKDYATTHAWRYGCVVGIIAGLVIAAAVMLPIAEERNTYRDITAEQADTIRRYEDITAEYEEPTAELFEMLEGGEK